MNKQYEKVLEEINNEIKDCANEAWDEKAGKCICAKDPCWRMVTKEAIQKELSKEVDEDTLKEIETLLMKDKSFGFLSIMGYYDNEKDEDVDEYLLCVAQISKRLKYGVCVGGDLWILKDKEIKISAKDLVYVLDLFRKYKRELICDLYGGVNLFNMDKYIERLKALKP